MSTRYQEALALAISAAREAGDLLRAALHRGPRGVDGKDPADTEAEQLLRDRLTAAFPSYGFRGEEEPSLDTAPRDPEQHYWLVDPNDGTSAFQDGHRGASVSIALVRGEVPVLGVIFAYAAPDDRGDLFSYAEGLPYLSRNGTPVVRSPLRDALGPLDLIAVSHVADERPVVNVECAAPARYLAVPGIAYRLALLAAGEVEAAAGLSRPRDFDYAAGHALLSAVGGVLLDEEGRAVSYSPHEMRRVQMCFAGSPTVAEALRARPWVRALREPSRAPLAFDLARPIPGEGISTDALARAQGCWFGQLAGDSLGSLVEFASAEEINARYPNGPRLLADGGTFDTLAGQPTDDSEMALCLARSLVHEGEFHEEAVAAAYLSWLLSSPFDIGGTTSQALRAVYQAHQQQQPLAEAARAAASRESQANGALMRVSPLGIFGWALAPSQLLHLAHTDAKLTHPHPICTDASAVFVAAIAHAIRTGDRPAQVFAFARQFADEERLHPILQLTLDEAKQGPPAFGPQIGWVRIAFQNAFHQLLTASSLEDAVVWTVRQGGDTDTNAAICGALLGAVHGRDAIPAQWRQMVRSCRPLEGAPAARRPRPIWLWPVDAEILCERLMTAGARHAAPRR